ncbi:MerR family transcriptional regulator [Candidatus Peregrinibacteria bacterium]|nr:MerR family transcriptional regulator [Candidatus Peregrinibacteria bacterium]
MKLYTVNQLAKLAGVSVRTLHHYDQIGLLKPKRMQTNGYRQYGEEELLQLQQILFFRELEFSLEEISRIMQAPGFDLQNALLDQRNLIELKQKRLKGLIKTIDKTLQKINSKIIMTDQDLYGSFNKDELEKYSEEAKQRWGHTDAYKQSQKRVKKMGKAGLARVVKEGEKIGAEIAALMDYSADSPEVQKLIDKHYNWLRNFYEPNLEMYRGLGQMYVDDARFKAYYEKQKPGLAEFMRQAMAAYCDLKAKD